MTRNGVTRPRFRFDDGRHGELVDFLGVDYFGHVTDVWLTATPDGAIAKVACLTRLQRLHLFEPYHCDTALWQSLTVIMDAGLAHLEGLTSLRELFLDSTRVTDAGLAYLEGLTNLSTLHVGHSGVSAAGIKKLQRALPRLRIDHTLKKSASIRPRLDG